MNVGQLYEMLKKTQEAKGFFFNRDRARVLDILQDLLVNREPVSYTHLTLPTIYSV